MSNQTQVTNLIQGIDPNSPAYTALQLLIQDVYRAYNQLFPAPVVNVNLFPGGANSPTSTVTGFNIVVQPTNLHLTWNIVAGAVTYEIRFNSSPGIGWDNSTFLIQTSTLQTDISPFTIPLVYGTYEFLIKAIDASGTYSGTAASFSITIPQITAPTVTVSVIGNNVLLKWTDAISVLQIDHYEVKSNGVLVGIDKATFDVVFEPVGGVYAFTVDAVDIVGNTGTPSGTVTVTLGNPSDYQTFGTILDDLSGTKVNCVLDSDGTLFAPVDGKTYQHHFTDNSYATWQDPITAGFPLYFQPDGTTATYTQTFDFGSIEPNVIVNIDYNTTRPNGTVNITATISVSNDNITYDTPVAGNTRFASSVRYAKVVITFTPADNKSSINFYNFRCVLNVHTTTDNGSVSALSTDGSGTVVTFNKTFLSPPHVTLTPVTNTSCKAVYNNLTSTGFNVFVFDDTGTRVSKTVNWIAVGIVQ